MDTRKTKQKQIVSDILEKAKRPLNVNEILAEGHKQLPGLGIATVYREIKRLSESKQLQTVEIPGDPIRYEICKHHHHHFKCNSCDKVYELENCSSDISKLVPKGFTPLSHELTFYGTCNVCT